MQITLKKEFLLGNDHKNAGKREHQSQLWQTG